MGASQSTSGASEPQIGPQVKTSYYELLGVERTATDDEIKKAYRRKALELHPDRNYGDVERTTSLFAEVQSAYEVLSDPQERSWYDSHEASILRGASGDSFGTADAGYEHDMKVTTADDIARMMGKFRTNVEFSDAPNGFFGFVRETFEQLKEEEEYAADWQGLDCPLYPSFGHRDDGYEDVVREFYAVWSGFSTRKSFAWKDKWRLSDAPDRRTRRLMEKENLKAREEGMREFNDAVRNLLLFVRKRDPRYTPNSQTAAEREQAQRDLAKKQAARAKAARAAQTAQSEGNAIPEWATRRDPEEEEDESEEEIEEEQFECVACNKTFKSERQWEAHEKSKKHQKAINALRRKMQKENAHLDLDDDDIPASTEFTPMDDELPEDQDDARSTNGHVDDLADEVDKLDLDGKAFNDEDSDDMSDAEQKSAKPKTKAKSKSSPARNSSPEATDSSPSPSDDEYAPRSEVESRFAPSTTHSLPVSDDEAPTTTGTSTPKLGKAAQKRAKKAAQQAALDASDQKHKCAVCQEAFPSKTKLFAHIKEEDHAAPISVTKGKKGDDEDWGFGGKKAKKKGKRK